jgi:hypothetical protein
MNVVKLFRETPEEEERVEADQEPDDDVWSETGYRPHGVPDDDAGTVGSERLREAEEAMTAEFNRQFEKDFGPWDDEPLPPRPLDGLPPDDDCGDLPF